MTDESSAPSSSPAAEPPRSGSRLPDRRTWIAVAIFLSLAVLALATSSISDRAIANVGVALFTCIALASLLTWFMFRSAFPFWVRLMAPLSLAGVATVLAICFPIVSLSGTLIPTFRWRWAPAADQLLERVEPVAAAAGVDLRTTTAQDFPFFLGPNRNASLQDLELSRDWQAAPPKLVWKQKIGAGWAAFSAVNGYAVTLEQRGPDELTTCYEIATGKLVWSHAETTRHETVLGGVGPRSTPTVHDGLVYSLGATGRLLCLNGADGAVRWKKDLMVEFGTNPDDDLSVVAWGRSSSPLVVDELVIVPAGGPPGGPYVSLVAFDRSTGQERWRAGTTQIAYASPALATLAGVLQVLSVNESNVTAHDLETGAILWSFDWPGNSTQNASTSQPQVLDDDRVLLSKGYGGGATLLKIGRDEAGKWSVDPLWSSTRVLKTKFTNVAVVDECAYGLSDGILECVDLKNGRSLWKRGRYEHGQLLAVDDLLLVLSEDGVLFLVEATPKAHRELGELPVLEGRTWNNLCLYGKRLLVRNGEEAACYDLP